MVLKLDGLRCARSKGEARADSRSFVGGHAFDMFDTSSTRVCNAVYELIIHFV